MQNTEEIFTYVKEYQKQGFYIYPFIPRTKKAYKGSNGFNDATNDMAKLSEWWMKQPKSNVGIFLKPSRLMAVDIDRHEDGIDGVENIKKIWQKFEPFPKTYAELTPRNGIHFFFKIPEGVEVEQKQSVFSELLNVEKTGIDIITYGIPISPTFTDVGQYKPLSGQSLTDISVAPEWLIQALQEKVDVTSNIHPQKIGKKYTGRLLDEIVQGTGNGNRNEWMMKMISKMLAVGAEVNTIYSLLLVINDNFLDEPLPLTELNATFKSRIKKHYRKGA